MGCNYYLFKKDKTQWVIPKNNVGEQIEKLLVHCQNESEITLDTTKCLERVDGLHIGKSSLGWHFNLCIYPVLDIYNLEDWITYFNDVAYEIRDEEDRVIKADNMLKCIVEREALKYKDFNSDEEYEKYVLECTNNVEKELFNNKEPYKSYDDYLVHNHAYRGVRGLMGHASSVWDMRKDEAWKNFLPMLNTFYPTGESYDLTTEWDFS